MKYSRLPVILSILGYIFNWDWTGLGSYVGPPHSKDSDFQRGKTLWDWLQLLIIPLALALIAVLFNRSERNNEQRIATDNQQETALQDYIKEMSELLLHEKLRDSVEEDEVRTIARVRTLTVLNRLDTVRKGSVIQFLYESGLIDREKHIISLSDADLREVDLREAKLSGVSLRKADLDGAKLGRAILFEASLFRADLREADLSGAILNETNLSGANLEGAIGVTLEELEKQAKSLQGTTRPDGSVRP